MKIIIQSIVLSALILSGTNCKTFAGSPNNDYLQKNFQCISGPASSELNQKYLKNYELYRSMAFHSEPAGEVFAVITGDSIAHLFLPERLGKYIPGIQVINRGIGGDTTALFLKRLEKDVLSLKPKAVILSIGGNDTLGGRCISKTLSNTAEILDKITSELPDTQVFVISVPPVNLRHINSIIPFYNRKLEYLTKKYKRVSFMDLWPYLSRDEIPFL